MSVLHRTRRSPSNTATMAPQAPASPLVPAATNRLQHTRTGAAWFSICTAALILVALLVFMLQNTGSVQVNFLWMEGNLPLALALLVAGVGVAIVTMTVGAARIAQLRRLGRQHRR